MTNILLGFHVLGAICFLVGGVAVGALQFNAIRQERPSQVYAYLRRAPFGAALVGTGALLTLGFGIALAEHKGLGLSPPWIQASLGLWVAAMVLGAFGGRTARHARHRAQQLAGEGDEPSAELRAMVAARGPLWASCASFLLLVAITVLMIWQPGATRYAVPGWVQAKISAYPPQFAYAPTRLPAGYSFSRYTVEPPGHFFISFRQPTVGTRVLIFTVTGKCPVLPLYNGYPEYDGRLRFGSAVAYTSHTRKAQTAWVCRGGAAIEAYSPVIHHVFDSLTSDELMTLVAYAEPLR